MPHCVTGTSTLPGLDIDEALVPVKKLRDGFGDEIEIAIEFHGQWNLTSAIRIAHALEPYKPMSLDEC